MKLKLNRKKLNQNGFDHVFLGVIVVVFVAILGTFYVVYSRAAASNYPIVHSSGKCLNNQKDVAKSGNPIEVYRCTGDAVKTKGAQQWTVKGDTIVNSNGYCLSAKGRTSSSYVVIQRCDSSALQTWTVNKTAKTIVSKPSGLCLGVDGGLTEDKTLVEVKTCNNAKLQQWTVQDGGNAAAPTISSFSASPTSVDSGKTTTLSWNYSDGNKCSVTPGGPTNTTAKSWTTPAVKATTTYTLSCQQDDGPVATKTVEVSVKAATGGGTVAANARFGMSAPADAWDKRLAEVGGATNIKFRRIFYQNLDANFSLVQRSINDKMVPIISFKVSPYSWRQVANGEADAKLRAMVTKLNAIPGEKFVALHHEPAKDGTAKDWADMQIHALPIIKAAGNNIKVGVIGNGWWWSNAANGYTDAEIAQYIPRQVIEVSDVIAGDTYQSEAGSEGPAPKMKNMASWARRVGGVKALGVGEFNGHEAKAITDGMNAIKAEPMFAWACMWNNTAGVGTVLEGARLEAFKAALLTGNPT